MKQKSGFLGQTVLAALTSASLCLILFCYIGSRMGFDNRSPLTPENDNADAVIDNGAISFYSIQESAGCSDSLYNFRCP